MAIRGLDGVGLHFPELALCTVFLIFFTNEEKDSCFLVSFSFPTAFRLLNFFTSTGNTLSFCSLYFYSHG